CRGISTSARSCSQNPDSCHAAPSACDPRLGPLGSPCMIRKSRLRFPQRSCTNKDGARWRFQEEPARSIGEETNGIFPDMKFNNDVIQAIGNTPLIKLDHASELTGCTILGKAEFMNPGQSVKDRAALFIIEDAVKRGTLKPGGIIVEGTAGNTGIGLAIVANALGYRTVIV